MATKPPNVIVDEKTKKRIDEHISNRNDVITDDDLNNAQTRFDIPKNVDTVKEVLTENPEDIKNKNK